MKGKRPTFRKGDLFYGKNAFSGTPSHGTLPFPGEEGSAVTPRHPLGQILAEDLERNRIPPEAARTMGALLRERYLFLHPPDGKGRKKEKS